MESEQITISDAIAKFFTSYGHIGKCFAFGGNDLGYTDFTSDDVKIDLKNCENNEHIKVSNVGPWNHVTVHALYGKSIIVWAIFQQEMNNEQL